MIGALRSDLYQLGIGFERIRMLRTTLEPSVADALINELAHRDASVVSVEELAGSYAVEGAALGDEIYRLNFKREIPVDSARRQIWWLTTYFADLLDRLAPDLQSWIQIDEATLGPDHPNVAVRLAQLAGSLRRAGQIDQAEAAYHRGLAILEGVDGSGHPALGTTLLELARLLNQMGRFVEAELICCRALKSFEDRFGSGHPNVARCRQLLEDLGRGRVALIRRELANDLDSELYRPLREIIAERLGGLLEQGNAIVARLMDLVGVELMRLCNPIYGELVTEKVTPDVQRALVLARYLDEDVVERLLPWSTQPKIIEALMQFVSNRALGYVNLPCATMTVAEILMARVEGSEARFRATADGRLEGAWAIPLPESTSLTFDTGVRRLETRVRKALEDLGRARGVPGDLMKKSALEAMAKTIREAVVVTCGPGGDERRRRIPYLVFCREADADIARRLAKLLEVRVCRIDPNNYADGEGAMCALIMQFARLRSQRESLQSSRKFPI